MAKFFLFIYVILFFVSCSSSQVVETKSQIVSLTKGETEQEFSKLFYDFQITILKKRDEVFRSIDKLYVWNGQYYIMDKTGKKNILRYRYGDEEAVENRYIDWMPKILCVDNGRIYSSMSPKSFSMYKELFPDSVANLVKTQDNDIILSFKMR